MKKLLLLTLCLFMTFALLACNDTGDTPDDGQTPEIPDDGDTAPDTPDNGDTVPNTPDNGDTAPDTPDGGDDTTEDEGSKKIDMSGISFESAYVAYTGKPHSIFVKGELPEGVTATYIGNDKTEIGTHTVMVAFSVPDGYETPFPMTAKLYITLPDVVDGDFIYADREKTTMYKLNEDYMPSVLSIPSSVTYLMEKAIYTHGTLLHVYVPETVTEIGDYALGYVDKNGTPTKISGFTVYGKAGSAAEAFCAENGIAFNSTDMPKVYGNADSLYNGQSARAHLADLIKQHGIDISRYGALFAVQLADAEKAVKDLTKNSPKIDVEKAVDQALSLPVKITVTVSFVDEAGNAVASPRKLTLLNGDSYKILTPTVTGYYTRDVYLEGVASSFPVEVVYKKIPNAADKSHVDSLLTDFVCWGDSLTAGAHGTNVSTAQANGINLFALGSTANGSDYVKVLQRLILAKTGAGVVTNNCGVGGEPSNVIAARAGSDTYHLYLDEAVTLTSGSVAIKIGQFSNTGRLGILRQTQEGGRTVNDVKITGKDALGNTVTVTGKITAALAPETPAGEIIQLCDYSYLRYTFTRTDGGTNTVTLAKGARIVTSGADAYDGQFCIIFMGQNGGYKDAAELIKQAREIIAANGTKEYLIISTHTGTTASRKGLNDALTKEFGDRYINMGTEFSSSEAYHLAGLSYSVIKSNQDNITNGKVSDVFLGDAVHPNALGYAVVGNVVMERLLELGVFDAIFDYYDSLQNS